MGKHLTSGIYSMGDLRKWANDTCAGIPDSYLVYFQVVGEKTGCWNMHCSGVVNGEHKERVHLRIWHPDLQDVPMGDEIFSKAVGDDSPAVDQGAK